MAENKDKKIAVIGAGPAGLGCANELAKAGFKVELFEASDCVGGLCRSFELLDQIVDIGPHKFFTKNKRASEYWHSYLNADKELVRVPRRSSLYYHGKFYTYPLKGLEPLLKLGFIESTLSVLSYLKAKVFPMKGKSFEDYMVNAFGRRLFQIFFKTYSKKVWDVDTTQLDSCFASQRIQKMDLFQTIKYALFGHASSKERTQNDFTYPKYGCGVVYENIARSIKAHGGIIHTSCPVVKLLTKDKKAAGIKYLDKESGRTVKADFDIVVTSANFKEMILSLDEFPAELKQNVNRLSYRSTVFVFVEADTDNKLKDNFCYILEPGMKTGRISNFDSWSKFMKKGRSEDILVLEYWCAYDDAFWRRSDEDLCSLAKRDLTEYGLFAADKLKRCSVLRCRDTYPFFPLGFTEFLEPVYKEIKEFKDLYFIGRCGTHKYNNQDHSLMMGLLCADKIKGDDSIDIWAVNNDPTYQESKIVD